MGYVISRHGGKVLVAAEAADERAITHALRQINDRMFLDVAHNAKYGCLEYKVMLTVAGDYPPVFICTWRDDQDRPLPLSHGLVEQVKQLIVTDTLAAADAHNQRVREQASRDTITEAETIAEDMLPWVHGRSRHHGVFARGNRERRQKHLTLRELETRAEDGR